MFVNREKELKILEEEYNKSNFKFCVIYGRRRVGKTTLIKEFLKSKKHIYFLATLENEKILLEKFKDVVAENLKDEFLKEIGINSFDGIFKYIANKKEKLVVVIDEFQYLSKINPAIASIFQSIIDNILARTNIMLILCGSIVSLMYKEALSYSSPLYGRRTSNIKLKPLNFQHLQAFFKGKTKKELIEIYSVFYGIPKYLELARSKSDIFGMIKENILDRDSFLYNEPYFLLQDEISENITYFSILETIAKGAHKIGEIAARLGKPVNNITSFMQKLIDLEIIYREIPTTEKNPSKSKKGLYFIKDNFIRFWFKYVFPYKSQLEISNTDFVLKIIKNTFSEYVSKTFEELAIEYSLKRFSLQKCGRWWSSKEEIDIVGIAENFILVGECKWQNRRVGVDVYDRLTKKAEHIKINLPKKYVIFSKEGFNEKLMAISKEKGVILVEAEEIEI